LKDEVKEVKKEESPRYVGIRAPEEKRRAVWKPALQNGH